ncbi:MULTISPECIES: BPSS1780 family membrane protein [unclassified Uliginosibacterium]|uniref:BPSS1780 family membrane protein n=1 Tax=unclassified Uliginosibacterium TaxID=2621521 RepID=UPI000C7CDE10|nr:MULTISPECIES: BPSS1780 family membrane protein [unclassified Uliginosibacterium]MDO6386188.1 BPSS1780 family membrane protein [Uliginosibacterium sp. 31-12]PLK49255.1 hypothetical protein C0V76_08640 [Uliginosibacterium sp. TH139]
MNQTASSLRHHGLAHLPQARRVSPLRCFSWLAAGWRLFAAHPADWILMALGAFALLAVSTLLVPIPLIGPILPPLLLALLMGGMLEAAGRQRAGESTRFELLFAGFRLHAGNLTLVGLFYAIPLVLLHLLAYLALSGGLLVSLLGISLGATVNSLAASAMGVLADLGVALVVFLLLWGMMLLALLLAPALIMKDNIASFDAMRLSLKASLRNPGAMFMLAIMFYLLFILALLPAGLGILIYIPVVVGAVQAAHTELFEPDPEPPLPNGANT